MGPLNRFKAGFVAVFCAYCENLKNLPFSALPFAPSWRIQSRDDTYLAKTGRMQRTK
jgi:hypothetical protein